MITEIKYTGLTASPSDYVCPDGELGTAINVVPEDGSLTPIVPPSVMFTLAPPNKVVFIHATRLYKNYIITATDADRMLTAFSYIGGSDMQASPTTIDGMPTSEKYVSISAMGNILILSTDKSIHYYYFKDAAYTYMGNKLPDIDMKFALNGQLLLNTHQGNFVTAEQSDVASKSFTTIAQVGWSGWSTNFVDGATLQANKEYKASVSYAGASVYFDLRGKREGREQEEHIAYFYRDVVFTSPFNFTSLRLVVIRPYNAYSDGPTGTFLLSEGQEILKGRRIISYTREGYESVMAAMNTFVRKEATEKGRFIYPFFVRYALRMYDGSIANISAPSLMIPNSGYVPVVQYTSIDTTLRLYSVLAQLQYCFGGSIPEEWRDIISGVVIYISEPIYPYSQGENFDEYKNLFKYKFYEADNNLSDLSNSYASLSLNGTAIGEGYSQYSLVDLMREHLEFGSGTQTDTWNIVQIAPREKNEIRKDALSKATFYKIKEFSCDEVAYTDTFVDLELDKGVLETLTTREVLDNSIVPYAGYAGARLTTYNNRLHIYDSKVTLPSPDNIFAQQGFTQAPLSELSIQGTDQYELYVFLRTQEGEKVVHRTMMGDLQTTLGLRWFFYPDANAYKAIISFYREAASGYYETSIELPLISHDYLSGAYYFTDDFDSIMDIHTGEVLAPVAYRVDDTLYKSSVIYVSEANNPFIFPSASAVSVGTTQILGLASSARALSEGQFGQFPMYAFCENGVWALELSSTGSYSARQPITRDVIIKRTDGSYNTQSITPIDSSVLFATDRGIMLLSGSDSQCLTDILLEDKVFSVLQLPKGEKLVQLAGLTNDHTDVIAFKEFVKDCGMVYDYKHQRIILYNPSKKYAYVYSLKEKAWGMMPSTIQSSLNSYPDALAMSIAGELISLSNDSTTSSDEDGNPLTGINGLVVTRPFKMDDPNTLKTLNAIIQRGFIDKTHIGQVLYGSRDLFSWHIIASSKDAYLRGIHGTPYKYFRLALVLKMDASESLYGFTCQFQPRLTNKPR